VLVRMRVIVRMLAAACAMRSRCVGVLVSMRRHRVRIKQRVAITSGAIICGLYASLRRYSGLQ
jgi:hypothetical protein